MSDERKKRGSKPRPKKQYSDLTEQEILNLTDDDRARYQVQQPEKKAAGAPEE